jgi:hypothetical protein
MQSSNQNIILAIKEDELSEFAVDIMDLNDEISDLFLSVDSKMKDLKSYFDCDEYKNLMNSYDSFRKNYAVVKSNLRTYSDDLITVINKVKAGDQKIALIIDEISELALSKAKNIENN